MPFDHVSYDRGRLRGLHVLTGFFYSQATFKHDMYKIDNMVAEYKSIGDCTVDQCNITTCSHSICSTNCTLVM